MGDLAFLQQEPTDSCGRNAMCPCSDASTVPIEVNDRVTMAASVSSSTHVIVYDMITCGLE